MKKKIKSSVNIDSVNFVRIKDYQFKKDANETYQYLYSHLKESCKRLQKAISKNEVLRTAIIQDRIRYLEILLGNIVEDDNVSFKPLGVTAVGSIKKTKGGK